MTWHPVAAVAGGPTVISADVGGLAMLLVHADGRWWAIEDRCSHANCAFSDDGEIDGLVAVCDCHGSEFDVTTGLPLRMPARDPIRTFPVRVVGDALEVEV